MKIVAERSGKNMKDEMMVGAEEMARAIGVSVQTLKSWYKFKKANPDNELATILPEASRGKRNKILFCRCDEAKLVSFRKSIRHGCYGMMGDITQKYTDSRKAERSRAYIGRIAEILEKNGVDGNTSGKVRHLLTEEANLRLGKFTDTGKRLPSRKEMFVYEVKGKENSTEEEFGKLFDAWIELLKPSYRNVLEAYYKDGKTFQEIGDEHGISRQSVQQKTKRFIKRIRKMMMY